MLVLDYLSFKRISGSVLQADWIETCLLFPHSPLSCLSPTNQMTLDNNYFSSIQSLSCVQLFATPTAARQVSLSLANSRSLLKLMSIESVMPSNYLILWCPLLLPPSTLPSIRVFSNESVLCIRWQKYWSCSFSISPSSEYLGLISLRMDWLGHLYTSVDIFIKQPTSLPGTAGIRSVQDMSGLCHQRTYLCKNSQTLVSAVRTYIGVLEFVVETKSRKRTLCLKSSPWV